MRETNRQILLRLEQLILNMDARLTKLERTVKAGFKKNYRDHELIIKVMNETDLDLKKRVDVLEHVANP